MDFSRIEKVKKINKKTLIAAIDIGKGVQFGYLRAPNGNEVKPFAFYNSQKSFSDFWEKTCRFCIEQGLEQIVIGFESTGPYAEPLLHFLRNKPAKLVQVNPMHTKRVKELTGNSPNKTDRKDPRVIADVISLGHALTLVVPEKAAAHLRRLTQARERAIKSRTAAMNQLQDLMFVIFPEFLSILKDISTKTAFYLIKRYPAPESIVALGVDGLTALVKRISRGKLGRDKAQALSNAAQSSVGIAAGKGSILLEVAYLVSQIEAHTQFIASLEHQMEDYLGCIPYSHSILSLKGIGPITAAGLIGEVGDFRKFATISEIMKLAGLDLFEVSSGNHKGRHHISKRGRSLMRKLLFFAAINAVKSNGIMHDSYQRMLGRGMPKVKALTAISRKLLRLIFALARDNTMYIDDYIRIKQFKLAA